MSKRKLRVFEAFAGIGAQASALSRMNIDYEIVGISDWYIHSIWLRRRDLNPRPSGYEEVCSLGFLCFLFISQALYFICVRLINIC